MKQRMDWIEITTNIGCKMNCLYCPQDVLLKEYYKNNKKRKSTMTLEDFKSLLRNISKGTVIAFCGMSEPFLADDCIKMILYAADSGYKVAIHTTLVGLKVDDIHKLRHENIILSHVHLPDDKGYMKIKVNEEYCNKVLLYKQILGDKITWLNIGGINDRLKELINDEIFSTKITLRGKNLNYQKIPKSIELVDYNKDVSCKNKKIICSRIYENSYKENLNDIHISVVMPDGSVLLCCMDYKLQYIIGNLYENTYEEILNGEKMKIIKDSMLCKNNLPLLCRNCEYARDYSSLINFNCI